MSKEKNIGFAVVGYGHIGKRHANMINGIDGCQLVAICDILPSGEMDLGPNTGIPYFTDLDEMLKAQPDIEVVCICTPNGLHAPQSVKALQARKHVVVEKPMGIGKEACEEVIHQALMVSRHVFVVMQNRYSPPSQWIKEVVDKNLLGDIRQVLVNCLWNRSDSYYENPWKGTQDLDGGTLYTQFSHFVDIMYWLFGDIKNIDARFDNHAHQQSIEFEDSGIVSFDFVKGGSGAIFYTTAVPLQNMESSMTIIGSKGSVKIGGQYMNEVEYCNIENYEMPTLPASNPPNDYGNYKGSAANHHYVFENVLATVRGETTATTNALEGLKVVDIIERIYEQKTDTK